MSVAATLIPKIIRVSIPENIYFNVEKIDAFRSELYGIDWGINDATYGTWMGIDRSVYPFWEGRPSGKSIHNHITGLIKLLDETQIKKS